MPKLPRQIFSKGHSKLVLTGKNLWKSNFHTNFEHNFEPENYAENDVLFATERKFILFWWLEKIN